MNTEILSLETSIANSLNFHDKIIAINKLGWKLRSIDTIRGISISQQALDLANKHDFSFGKANAHCNLGRCFVITGQHDLALKHALESIDLFEPLNDANGLLICMRLLMIASLDLRQDGPLIQYLCGNCCEPIPKHKQIIATVLNV